MDSQLKTNGEINTRFDLVDIVANDAAKSRFLKELLHYVVRIE